VSCADDGIEFYDCDGLVGCGGVVVWDDVFG